MKLKSVLLAAAIALGVLGGTAWAAQTIGSIVGADGTIHGCYTRNIGLLRVVGRHDLHHARAPDPVEPERPKGRQG